MTDTYNPKSHFSDIGLPAQDLTKLSFCNGIKVANLQSWTDQLQITRVTQTSVQLYKYLPEITRLKTDPKTRLEMLEVLRPNVQISIAGLAKQFLGQPLILPEDAQKTAIVAQALQKSMINGYSICVRDLISQKSLNSQGRDGLAKAISRAMFSIGLLYLRSCQIYTPLPKGLWLLLHHLYRTADSYQILTVPIQDPMLKLRQTSNVRDTYLRTIMLACSNSNQLSQKDLAMAFEAFESWAHPVLTREKVARDNANPFFINLSLDEPPRYKERASAEEQGYRLELDFSRLVTALARRQDSSTGNGDGLIIPRNMPADLVNHLINTWAETADRQQHRRKIKSTVDICVGITECHYFLAGEQDFGSFLGQARKANPEGWPTPSSYASLNGFTLAERSAAIGQGTIYKPTRVTVQNISAGGYCLYWQGNMPHNATAGQLLGIREVGKRDWNLGVVRWIRQLRGASQMGIQVLALDAKPVATSVRYPRGGYSDFMRGLQLAPYEAGQTASTLLTAAAPFQEFSKVQLKSGSQTLSLNLDQCILSTNAIRQFDFHIIDTDLDLDLDPDEDREMDRDTGTVVEEPDTVETDTREDGTATISDSRESPTLFDFDRDWD
jgi:hypothetical protein